LTGQYEAFANKAVSKRSGQPRTAVREEIEVESDVEGLQGRESVVRERVEGDEEGGKEKLSQGWAVCSWLGPTYVNEQPNRKTAPIVREAVAGKSFVVPGGNACTETQIETKLPLKDCVADRRGERERRSRSLLLQVLGINRQERHVMALSPFTCSPEIPPIAS